MDPGGQPQDQGQRHGGEDSGHGVDQRLRAEPGKAEQGGDAAGFLGQGAGPQPERQPTHCEREPHKRQRPGERAGDEADQRPGQIQPGLRLSRGPQQATRASRLRWGGGVEVARNRLAAQRPQAHSLERREASGAQQGGDEDRQSHPHDDERGTGEGERPGQQERGQAEREGGREVGGLSAPAGQGCTDSRPALCRRGVEGIGHLVIFGVRMGRCHVLDATDVARRPRSRWRDTGVSGWPDCSSPPIRTGVGASPHVSGRPAASPLAREAAPP